MKRAYEVRTFPTSQYDVEYDTPTVTEVFAESFEDAQRLYKTLSAENAKRHIWAIDVS